MSFDVSVLLGVLSCVPSCFGVLFIVHDLAPRTPIVGNIASDTIHYNGGFTAAAAVAEQEKKGNESV